MADSPIKSTSDTAAITRRQRSGSSTMIYHPEDHGDSPHLPAIAVEDLTAEAPEDLSLLAQREEEEKIARTARPPVELMADA